MAPPNLKKMIQVKIKPRQDSYSDQFSRILMVKMLMMTAAFTGLTWMKDKVKCIVPKNHDADGGFVSKSCWINGFYIFKGLKQEDTSYYYGIPKDVLSDGYDKYGVLCSTKSQQGRANTGCTPLEKTFFLQYQWFPLVIAAIAFLYYLPYMMFRIVNTDLQEIKDVIKGKNANDVDAKSIVKRFFVRKNNSTSRLKARVLLNIIVKVLYVVVNVLGMVFVDSSTNSEFMQYGPNWSSWTTLENEDMHDYTNREYEKAGHLLLPSFGLCQVYTAAQDIKTKVANDHTYICELSQHVIYQYILIVMWYMFIFGIIISIIGLIQHMVTKTMAILSMNAEGELVRKIYSNLTVREKEYLDFIRRKNLPVFTKVLHEISQLQGIDRNYSTSESDRSSFGATSPEKENMMME